MNRRIDLIMRDQHQLLRRESAADWCTVPVHTAAHTYITDCQSVRLTINPLIRLSSPFGFYPSASAQHHMSPTTPESLDWAPSCHSTALRPDFSTAHDTRSTMCGGMIGPWSAHNKLTRVLTLGE